MGGHGRAIAQHNRCSSAVVWPGALWLLYAIVDRGYPKAGRQSPGWYGLLKSAIGGQRMLAAKRRTMSNRTRANIRREVGERLDKLDRPSTLPGLKWVTRAGINVAWSEYHALTRR